MKTCHYLIGHRLGGPTALIYVVSIIGPSKIGLYNIFGQVMVCKNFSHSFTSNDLSQIYKTANFITFIIHLVFKT